MSDVILIESLIDGMTGAFGSPALMFLILGALLFIIVSFVLKVSPIFSLLFASMFIVVAVINVAAPIGWGMGVIILIMSLAAYFIFRELFLR